MCVRVGRRVLLSTGVMQIRVAGYIPASVTCLPATLARRLALHSTDSTEAVLRRLQVS